MTTHSPRGADDAGLPALHQGDAGADLGRDHEARAHRAVLPRLPAGRADRRRRTLDRAARPTGRSSGSTRESLEFDPPRRLVHALARALRRRARAEGESRVTWEIEPQDDGTRCSPSSTTGSRARRRPPPASPARAGCTSSAASRPCSRPAPRADCARTEAKAAVRRAAAPGAGIVGRARVRESATRRRRPARPIAALARWPIGAGRLVAALAVAADRAYCSSRARAEELAASGCHVRRRASGRHRASRSRPARQPVHARLAARPARDRHLHRPALPRLLPARGERPQRGRGRARQATHPRSSR